MNRAEFWDRFAEETGLSREKSRLICDTVLIVLEKCIKEEDRVTLYNFGTFKRKTRSARRVKNIHGDGWVDLPEKEFLAFDFSDNFGQESAACDADPDYKKLGKVLRVAFRDAEEQKMLNRKEREREKIADIREKAQNRVEAIKSRRAKPKPRRNRERESLLKLLSSLNKSLAGIDNIVNTQNNEEE